MSQWTDDNPGLGDADHLRTRSSRMDTILRELDHARGQVRDQRDAVAGTWTGASAEAYLARLDAWLSKADTLIDGLAPYSGGARAYGNAIEDIDDAATSAQSDLATAVQVAANANTMLTTFPPPGVTYTAKQLRQAQSDRSDARADQSRLTRELAELVADRSAADTTFVAAIATVDGIGAWSSMGAAMTASGMTALEELDTDVIRNRMIWLTDFVREGGSELTDELNTLLGVWGDDPIFMRDFYETLGGEGLIDLMNHLDAQAIAGEPESAAEVLVRLRGGLSAASTLWDEQQAQDLADAMVNARGASAVAVAYLFADPVNAPMSPRLAGAAANAIQQWETEHGRPFVWQGPNLPGGMAAELDYWPLGEGQHTVDPAAYIFDQLRLDPEAATDWLGGAGRAEYWYGERAWEDAGGFTSPMRLWEDIQGVPGALAGKSDYDSDGAKLLAEVNTRILSSWVNRDYRGYIDPEALQAIGEVVAIQLPFWVETTIALDGDTRAREKMSLVWMGVGGQWVVQADRNALGILLAQIARDPEASARVMGEVQILEGKILGGVGTVPGLDYDEALDRIAGMHGMVDGGDLANDLSTAAMQDRIREWTVGALGLGAGELVGKGGFPASLAVTMGENYVADNWATAYQDELEAYWAGSDDSDATDRTDDVRAHLTELVNNSVPDEVIAASGTDRNQYIEQRMGEYKDKLERLDPAKVH